LRAKSGDLLSMLDRRTAIGALITYLSPSS
jgi:hypothetical protein